MTNIREQRRMACIRFITELILHSRRNEDELIQKLMYMYPCSRKTAKEYIDAAMGSDFFLKTKDGIYERIEGYKETETSEESASKL